MRKKYKSTGCARFFIAMLFIAPLAYLGASYYNGEDGIQKIKDFFSGSKDTVEQVDSNDNSNDTPSVSESKVKRLEQRIERLEEENDDLRDEIKKKDAEIEALKNPDPEE